MPDVVSKDRRPVLHVVPNGYIIDGPLVTGDPLNVHCTYTQLTLVLVSTQRQQRPRISKFDTWSMSLQTSYSGHSYQPIEPNLSSVSVLSRNDSNDGDDDGTAGGKKKKSGKRRKVNHACIFCRRSHMTCDEGRPCQRWCVINCSEFHYLKA